MGAVIATDQLEAAGRGCPQGGGAEVKGRAALASAALTGQSKAACPIDALFPRLPYLPPARGCLHSATGRDHTASRHWSCSPFPSGAAGRELTRRDGDQPLRQHSEQAARQARLPAVSSGQLPTQLGAGPPLSDPPCRPACSPTLEADYTLGKVLGKGAFGVVRLVLEKRTGEAAAAGPAMRGDEGPVPARRQRTRVGDSSCVQDAGGLPCRRPGFCAGSSHRRRPVRCQRARCTCAKVCEPAALRCATAGPRPQASSLHASPSPRPS